jgi:protein involved in polysaccharide export with SLBB domain
MKIFQSLLLLCLLFISSQIFSQSRSSANYIVEDIPGELKININIWGYINYPGRYEIPISTNLIQLITLAGGPKTHAVMDEIMIYRVTKDGRRILLEVDLEDPESISDSELALRNEDTIVIDYSAIVTWNEIFGIIATPLAVAASILVLVREVSK